MRQNRKRTKLAALAALCVLLCACVALSGKDAPEQDRGLTFDHALHVEADMACTDCHDFESEIRPDHSICSMCHDLPEDHEIPEDEADREGCALCHNRPDFSVSPRVARLPEENIFDHAAHIAAEVECSACHDEETRALPKGSLKPFCMDCHAQQADKPELNGCATCHQELSKEALPKFREGRRIAHDALDIWEITHGREARVGEAYCNLCHEAEADCQDCHRVNAPKSHNVTWRRRTHGLEASWDRRKCAACHEEESCERCHENTKPASHRSFFGAPRNGHCVQCHFPQNQNGCATCHEDITHREAMASPHALGIYPSACGTCHPGGMPYRAPHPMNNTVRCIVCHR